jgi:peptidoglycan/LPS O-acetylase OafA/YrhL
MQIRNIQILRGMAAITVVLCHIHEWDDKKFGSHAVTPAIFLGGFTGVDLFFVISGFIMVFIQPAPIDSYRSYLRFLVHRFTRIYPPVWIVMFLLLFVWLVHPELFNHYGGNHVEIFRSFLLLPQDYQPLLNVAWTLIHEVYFYLVVSFALMFAPRGRWIFGFVWFLLVLIIFSIFGKGNFGQIRTLQLIFSPFSLTFLLGYFIGLSADQIRKTPPLLALGLLLGGITSLVVLLPASIGIYPDNNSLSRFFTCGLLGHISHCLGIAIEKYNLKNHFLGRYFLCHISYPFTGDQCVVYHFLEIAIAYPLADSRRSHHLSCWLSCHSGTIPFLSGTEGNPQMPRDARKLFST